MKNFHTCPRVGETEFVVISKDRWLFAGILPLPTNLVEIEAELKTVIGEHVSLPIPIEFIFPHTLINRAIEEGAIGLDDRIVKANDPELPTNINLTEIYAQNLPEEYLYLSKKVRKDTKTNFADWSLEQDGVCFECLRPVFEQLEDVLAVGQK